MTVEYGPHVRVRHSMLEHMLYVEVKQADGTWAVVDKIDEMSDDYAYATARSSALAARRALMENENVIPNAP